MSESATLVTRFLYGVILASVLITGVLAMTATKPQQAEAAGMMADAQCVPAIQVCGCGMIKGPKGCIPGLNKWMCPCFDETNGFVTPGICIANFKCQAQGQPGQPPMLPMPPMPPPPSPPTDPCMAGGVGGNFGEASRTATTSTSTPAASSTCPGGSGGGFDFPQPTFPTYDPFAGTGGTGSGTNFDTTSGTNNNTVSSLLDGTIGTGGTTDTGGSVVPGSTSTGPTRPPFGSVDGISGDVRLQGTAVSLLVSNRDITRGTQVSGMFGITVIPGITANTVFKTMCGLRPWSNSYLSFIVPSTYFDSLCTARGFALSAKITGTTAGAAAKTTPTAAPTVKPPPPPPPPAYLGALRADIWATPPSVSTGQRTSIFWEAKGVSTCSITSNDGSFSGSSLSGHASTQPLTKNTTFSITCMSATSTVSNQVVVTVQ